MELAIITLRFETPEEQKFVEEHVNWATRERETWEKDSGFVSWTDFDVSGCKPSDIQKTLDEVMLMLENKK